MTLRVLSLGAGVQSTVLALMAAEGFIEPPDFAVFADTGDEKRATYRHLDWIEGKLSFPLYRVRRFDHSLSAYCREGLGKITPPFFTDSPYGMLPIHCSKEFKTRAIIAKVRSLIGLKPGERGPSIPFVEMMLGISCDEAHRMKPAEPPWMENRWPLIEMGMRRHHCVQWLMSHDYPIPPKSACVFCPLHDAKQWQAIRDNQRDDDWLRAITFDAAIRNTPGVDGQCFVHPSRRPLAEAALDDGQLDLWGNECEGMCGV